MAGLTLSADKNGDVRRPWIGNGAARRLHEPRDRAPDGGPRQLQEVIQRIPGTDEFTKTICGFRYLINGPGHGVEVQEVGRIVYADLRQTLAIWQPESTISSRRGLQRLCKILSQPAEPSQTESSTRGDATRGSHPRGMTDRHAPEETQIDRWLSTARLVKTRPLGTRLYEGGHILVNRWPAEPSTKVGAGDRVEGVIAGDQRVLEVVQPIESPSGAVIAATCYINTSPPGPPPRQASGRPCVARPGPAARPARVRAHPPGLPAPEPNGTACDPCEGP